MKKSIIFLLVFAFALNYNLKAQTCDYFPLNEGSIYVIKNYDKKDKLTGWSKQTIKKKETTATGINVTLSVENYDTKADTAISKGELKYECKDNVLYVDMNSMLAPGSMTAYEGMDVKVTTENMTMPSTLKVGDVLDIGKVDVKVSSNGMQIFNSVTSITNRKVAAIESITTPAGTFECYKLTYDVESKMMFSVTMSMVEWYSKEAGSVRSEAFDKNGKLTSYSVLESLTKK